ncbi:hypothetical protein CQA38_07530 [Campylobacter sp. MIT 12-5580]|uniref:hypothetical protein n=1 Tax=Campylobacter sp. MIT 12-5580 TaxID=2040651 RepID=UPI0010F9F326|nr:hypothetical protein [Campylobacter sp. MIT 12-5580]TKX28518.1 hypothetical protein CQA38_07530 [Campylobacter sp. MIT 12-5580]
MVKKIQFFVFVYAAIGLCLSYYWYSYEPMFLASTGDFRDFNDVMTKVALLWPMYLFEYIGS